MLLEQDEHFALVDAGLAATQEELVAYLQEAGVRSLDFAVLTHPHADHMGGMQYILESFSVGTLYVADLAQCAEQPGTGYEKLLEAARREGVPVRTMQAGERYALGRAALCVLAEGEPCENLNDTSPVLRFEAPAFSLLCTGDGEEAAEQKCPSVWRKPFGGRAGCRAPWLVYLQQRGLCADSGPARGSR